MAKTQVEAAGQGGVSSEKVSEAELQSLPENERELFREVVQALRTIRYGSIVLTVHDGQLVEINKSVRIRKNRKDTKE
jgi:hypothetical protein